MAELAPGSVVGGYRIDRDGEREHAYLTDFGIARHVAATSGLTQTGSVVGTLDYLAPERMIDGGGDARSDVYALGCVLFQVLTGSVPYPRDSEVAKMYAHLNAPVPDARELKDTVPDALAELALQAMAKEPDARVHSAAELAERLLGAADTRESPTPATLPAPPPIPEAPPTIPGEPPATEPAGTEATRPALTEPAVGASTTGIEARRVGGLGALRGDIARESAPPARRGRRGAAVAAVAGGALAVIAVVAVLLSGGPGGSGDSDGSGSGSASSGNTGDTRPARLNPTALEPIELEPGADGVATGEGFVWVANRDLDTVTRVNAESRQVEGEPIEVGQEPDSLAAGLGAMWVTNTSGNSVTRMDPGTGEILGTHRVGAAPEGIVTAHGKAWVVNGRAGSVSRLDAGGNTLGSAMVGEGPVQVAPDSDAIWVTVSKENKIVELDGQSGEPTGRSVSIGGTPRGIAFDPERGELWVSASAANRLVVINPAPPKVVGEVNVPDNPREVRFGLGAIWVTSATAERVTAIDPERRRIIKSVPIQGTTYGLAVGEGLAWAASESEGLLLPVRPR